jgi:hypothetical protein
MLCPRLIQDFRCQKKTTHLLNLPCPIILTSLSALPAGNVRVVRPVIGFRHGGQSVAERSLLRAGKGPVKCEVVSRDVSSREIWSADEERWKS